MLHFLIFLFTMVRADIFPIPFSQTVNTWCRSDTTFDERITIGDLAFHELMLRHVPSRGHQFPETAWTPRETGGYQSISDSNPPPRESPSARFHHDESTFARIFFDFRNIDTFYSTEVEIRKKMFSYSICQIQDYENAFIFRARETERSVGPFGGSLHLWGIS